MSERQKCPAGSRGTFISYIIVQFNTSFLRVLTPWLFLCSRRDRDQSISQYRVYAGRCGPYSCVPESLTPPRSQSRWSAHGALIPDLFKVRHSGTLIRSLVCRSRNSSTHFISQLLSAPLDPQGLLDTVVTRVVPAEN